MASALDEVPTAWMADVAALFEGHMTWCSRRHAAGGPCDNGCDNESLVPPMLRMYFNLRSEQAASASEDQDHLEFLSPSEIRSCACSIKLATT